MYRAAESRCFNPRPRAGGDTVSSRFFWCSASFNPRPRAGGDYWPTAVSVVTRCFNPRPRAGGDLLLGGSAWRPRVSIHAPARGATETETEANMTSEFQSTPPRGGRPIGALHVEASEGFQSTPPRGGRLPVVGQCAKVFGFNPRPRAGGDLGQVRGGLRAPPVSIHAPARGATPGDH